MKHLKKSNFLVLFAVAASSMSVPAFAMEETTEKIENEGLPYKYAMRCAAYNTFMAGILEEDDAEAAAPFDDSGKRWLTMAFARDGEDGAKAEREFDEVLDKLIEKVEKLGEEDDQLENFLTGVGEICTSLENENAEEFSSIIFDE